jgi:hypothetical protein
MDIHEQLVILSNLTQSEYRKMQKALRVIMSIGIDQFTALEMILVGIKNKQVQDREYKTAFRKGK